MPIPLHKPHDEFFKETFRQKDLAEDFFRHFLPPEIVERLDFSRLELENSSYTDETLAERFSDVVYRCSFGKEEIPVKITVLLEHKTGRVLFPHLQLLKYITNVWDEQIKQKQKPTPVLPVLFVQGPDGIQDEPLEYYIDGANNVLLPYLPRFQYVLIDLTKVQDGQILHLQLSLLKVGLLLMKHIWEEDHVFRHAGEIFSLLQNVIQEERAQLYTRSIFVYLFKNSEFKKEERIKLIHTMPNDLKNIALSTLDQVYEEGKIEGEVLGLKKSIRPLLLRGYTAEQVVDLLNVPLSLVQEVEKELKGEI